MTTEQYGLFSVYLSWVSVLTILGTMNFETCIYINSLAKFDNEKDKNDIAVSLIDLAFVITIIWFLIYLLAKPFWNNVLGMSTTMVVLMFTEIVFFCQLLIFGQQSRSLNTNTKTNGFAYHKSSGFECLFWYSLCGASSRTKIRLKQECFQLQLFRR